MVFISTLKLLFSYNIIKIIMDKKHENQRKKEIIKKFRVYRRF